VITNIEAFYCALMCHAWTCHRSCPHCACVLYLNVNQDSVFIYPIINWIRNVFLYLFEIKQLLIMYLSLVIFAAFDIGMWYIYVKLLRHNDDISIMTNNIGHESIYRMLPFIFHSYINFHFIVIIRALCINYSIYSFYHVVCIFSEILSFAVTTHVK
jgi:hypothetical protein